MPKPVLLVLASTYPRWTGDPEPGFVHELCRRLTAWFEVIAVVPDAHGAEPGGMLDGVEVVRYRYAPRRLETLVHDGGIVANLRRSWWKWLLLPGFVLGQWWAARRIMRQRAVALIHAHWLLPQGLVARSLAKHGRIPFAVTSHGGDLFGLRGRLPTAAKRLVAASSSGMTVVSRPMAEEVSRLSLAPRVLAVIPMGVDLRARFVPDPGATRLPAELLFVGRLVPKKGLDLLVAAMPAICAGRPDATLRIAGFGPEEERLRQQVAALGLEDRVRFCGALSQDQLPPLYQRATVFVAPFRRDASGDQEGLPVAMMEALACGCPVVVGEVAGVRDLLGDAETSCVVPVDDVPALARAVLSALDHPEEARRQAESLLEAVRARVDWERIAAQYAELLLGLV